MGDNMKRLHPALALYFFGAALGCNAGFAKEPSPCHDDMEKFCPGIPPGRAMNRCIKKHSAELSAACQQIREERRQKATAFKIACGHDSKKFCKSAKRGSGGIVNCLRVHQADLSSQCKANLGM